MTIRYDRNRRSTVNLTGGPYVTFPPGVVEVDLDDSDRERRIAEHYDGVELIEEADSEEADLCGAIKTNGEPCDRLADECRWHSDDEETDEADAEEADADIELEQESEPEEQDDEDVEQCGVEMTDGSVCDRPADECRFHADD